MSHLQCSDGHLRIIIKSSDRVAVPLLLCTLTVTIFVGNGQLFTFLCNEQILIFLANKFCIIKHWLIIFF